MKLEDYQEMLTASQRASTLAAYAMAAKDVKTPEIAKDPPKISFLRSVLIIDGLNTPQSHDEVRAHLLENLKAKVSALDALIIQESKNSAVMDAIGEVQMAGMALACHGELKA